MRTIERKPPPFGLEDALAIVELIDVQLEARSDVASCPNAHQPLGVSRCDSVTAAFSDFGSCEDIDDPVSRPLGAGAPGLTASNGSCGSRRWLPATPRASA